jgi:hypothetical protein
MPSDADATRRWLDDIRHHITPAQTFVEGMSYEAFRDDLRAIYAPVPATFIATIMKTWLPPSFGS